MSSLPIPSAEALAHSDSLVALIREEINQAGGWLSFERYMALALYAPGYGYYSAGLEKFGEAGDFVTAPEISPLFALCIAKQMAQILSQSGGSILELGAGSGKLAVEVLSELSQLQQLPEQYLIMEISPVLRQQQQALARAVLPAHLQRKIVWLEQLPSTFTGVVIGNEVLDALPAHLVVWHQQGISERGLTIDNGQLSWCDQPLVDGALFEAASKLKLPAGYLSELNLAARSMMASLARMLTDGVILMLDYGFPRREFYHPQRDRGSLMCHYRHQAHDNPLLYPGLQDITTHVDFTAVAEAAVAQNASLLGYTGQAQFLINCGITDLLAEIPADDMSNYLPQVVQVQKLLSPAEMGELFKVIAFGKAIDIPLTGFLSGDKKHSL